MNVSLKKNIVTTLALVGLIWAVYLISLPLSAAGWDLKSWGLHPRTVAGLVGVLTMPFLHDSAQHLLANTVPLTVLLLLLGATRPNPRRVLFCLWIATGLMLWGLGRNRIHVGCSALVYTLAAYLIAAGFYEKKFKSAAAAILVAVLYGSLFWGLFPTAGEYVSWDGHLFAALVGALFAHLTLRPWKPAPRPAVQTNHNVQANPEAAVQAGGVVSTPTADTAGHGPGL